MSVIYQGLSISLLGMLITFSFFGLLILLIVSLQVIFKVDPTEKGTYTEGTIESEPPELSRDRDRRKAAGIAVAVAALWAKKQAGSGLGQLLEEPPGRWWPDAHHQE